MKKYPFLILLICFQNTVFSQLIITGGIPDSKTQSSTTFQIDTISNKKDSIFLVIRKYRRNVLIHEEEQISITKEQKMLFHGKTKQWYKNGSKKLEGQFGYGSKVGIWKYWDKKGRLTQDTDFILRGRGSESGFMFIDGEKVKLRD